MDMRKARQKDLEDGVGQLKRMATAKKEVESRQNLGVMRELAAKDTAKLRREAQSKRRAETIGEVEAKLKAKANRKLVAKKAVQKLNKTDKSVLRSTDTTQLPFKGLGGQIASVTKDTVKLSVGKFRQGMKAINKWVALQHQIKDGEIPEALVILVQVVEEDPRFLAWIKSLSKCNLATRIAQLRGVSAGMRSDPSGKELADAFDTLEDPRVFEAFMQALHDR